MAPAYILQTMCGLVKGAFAHSKGDYGFDVIELLMGFEQADGIMQVRRCCTFFASKNFSNFNNLLIATFEIKYIK